MSDFKFTFSDQAVPSASDLKAGFVIKANPSTDIWAKPPSTHRFNSPILHKTVPLSSFQRASVHISAKWSTLYDQGGLILVLNRDDGTQKWVKTGIEFVDGKPHVSTVGKDNWADWSLLPMPPGNETGARIEMVREKGVTLWIYLIEGEERKRIRQVTWAFGDEESTECWVGVYAAKRRRKEGSLWLALRSWRLSFQRHERYLDFQFILMWVDELCSSG
ncbi:hypothetical protein ACJ72_06424 [Emergomyces africanus]|uniref:Uncharacterized protein n=1 Tax=Emergomyces africanus TaxID=1955775 RepID=A0A1B7NR58_9EURO|nr:hypothetical protein ACJ72_06424 [Emergomyces africanus]